jgi:hypothetical protein
VRSYLSRFWFEFEGDMHSLPPGTVLGCGVTALDREDALSILASRVFKGSLAPIRSETSDVDVSTLDAGHILPNMDDPTLRGVWFPRGFR